MRIVAQVFASYGLLLVLGAIWRFTPLGGAIPDVVALSAVYLGLTARRQLAPSIAGAVVVGYLADLLVGSPRGMLALTAGIVCVLGHVISGRLLVRGWLYTAVFSVLTAVFAGLVTISLRGAAGLVHDGLGAELFALGVGVAATAVLGPFFFRFFRLVDAQFARTQRDRDAALEGLIR